MPRTTKVQITSAFDQVQKQARQLLAKLRSEIHSKEGDLRRLKDRTARSQITQTFSRQKHMSRKKKKLQADTKRLL